MGVNRLSYRGQFALQGLTTGRKQKKITTVLETIELSDRAKRRHWLAAGSLFLHITVTVLKPFFMGNITSFAPSPKEVQHTG